MHEVTGKLNELLALLQTKIAENEALSKQLTHELGLAKADSAKNSAKADELNKRAKEITDVEDVIKVSEEAKAKLAEANRVKVENIKVTAALGEAKLFVEKTRDELNNLISIYKKKNESLEAEKVQLEIDRKDMRAKILEDLKKLK
jgi:hypothetical protein